MPCSGATQTLAIGTYLLSTQGVVSPLDYSIRMATSSDVDDIVSLMPRLADFNVPKNRNPDHLGQGDLAMVHEWAGGQRQDVDVCVASTADKVVGVAMLSERKELLSTEPSVHLEVLALEKSAEGFGIATALMDEVDRLAKLRGAKSVTLHVFANNTKARALYERKGFEGELIRCIKHLD